MMTLLMISIVCSLYFMIFSLNPVKMSILLLIMSSLMFLNMFMMMGSTWMPMIFYLLFMGGILIVFMVISSVMPNEKTGKMKSMNITIMSMTSMLMVLWMMMNLKNGEKSEDLYTQMKWFFQSNENMLFLMMVMVLYFFTFVKMISKNKTSLRTNSCQLNKTL